MTARIYLTVFALSTLVLGPVTHAQQAPVNFESKDYASIADKPLYAAWDGDFTNATTKLRAQAQAGELLTEGEARQNGAFVQYEVVGDETALSIAINFSDFDLGSNSFIQILGTEDETLQVQWFDHKTLEAWEGTTAIFNGSYVDVLLFVSPDDPGAFYEINSIYIGQPPLEQATDDNSKQQKAAPGEQAICSVDNRQRSNDNRLGRIISAGCTGWMESGGKFLTAGHCVRNNKLAVLQFEVPSSLPDGTLDNPLIENQYKIRTDSIVFADGGVGNDWAIFDVEPSFRQPMPHTKYGSFTLLRDDNPTEVWVRGYGLDDDPVGDPPTLRNSDNQTQQEDSGAFVGVTVASSSNAAITHGVDTRNGNSGSPIFLVDNPDIAIGIHSHGDCDGSSANTNHGTSFLNDALWNAIHGP